MDPIAPSLRANVDHRIPHTDGLRIKDLIPPHQPQRKRIQQRIPRVTRLKPRLSTKIRHPKTVPIPRHAMHHTSRDLVIPPPQRLIRLRLIQRPKPQRIHHRQRPRIHRKNIPQNPADTRSRALIRLDVARMIVRLNLERTSPPIPHIDDPGILPRPLHHAARPGLSLAARRQPLQMHPRRLIRAMLRPHHRKNPQLSQRRRASQRRFNPRVFIRGDAVLLEQRRGNRSWRGGCGSELGAELAYWAWLAIKIVARSAPSATTPNLTAAPAPPGPTSPHPPPPHTHSPETPSAPPPAKPPSARVVLEDELPQSLIPSRRSRPNFASASPSGTGAA